MLRLQVASDLHTDFHPKPYRLLELMPVAAPTLVLAGDVCEGRHIEREVRSACSRWDRVVYVCGNHDLYQVDRSDLYATLQRLSDELGNFVWLYRSSVDIDGVTIHGCTLWFPDDPLNVFYKRNLSDFNAIPNFEPWVYREHELDMAFLRDKVHPGDVVVTHHLPSPICIPERFVGSEFNRFYCGQAQSIIWDNEPALWIHGHSHDVMDDVEWKTRIVRNPHGYLGSEPRLTDSFRRDFVVDVNR